MRVEEYEEPPMKWNTGTLQYEPDTQALKDLPHKHPLDAKRSDVSRKTMILWEAAGILFFALLIILFYLLFG